MGRALASLLHQGMLGEQELGPLECRGPGFPGVWGAGLATQTRRLARFRALARPLRRS